MITRYTSGLAALAMILLLGLGAACNENTLDNPEGVTDGDIVDSADNDTDDTADTAVDGDTPDADTVIDGDDADAADIDGDTPDTDTIIDGDDTDAADIDGDTPDTDTITDGDDTDAADIDGDTPDTDTVDMSDGDTDDDIIDEDTEQLAETDPEPEQEPEPAGTQVAMSLMETSMLTSSSAGNTLSTSAMASASVIRYASPYQNTAEKIGECYLYPYDTSSSMEYETLSGGTVTITGTLLDPVILTPSYYENSGWAYTSNLAAGTPDIFNPEASLSMQIAGQGDIPGYTGSVSAVADIAGLQPAIMQENYSYTAGDPLNFTWTAGNGDMMIVTVTGYLYDGYTLQDGMTISCMTDDDGAFGVPAAALARLPQNAQMITLSITRRKAAQYRQGDIQYGSSTTTSLTRTWSPF